MQQFIPFEDDWDALEKMLPVALIPYRVGLVPVHEPASPRADVAVEALAGKPVTPG